MAPKNKRKKRKDKAKKRAGGKKAAKNKPQAKVKKKEQPCSKLKGRVEIVWIKTGDKPNDKECHDSKREVDLKVLNYDKKKLRIHYRVKGRSQKVTLWVEYEKSKVHDDFYNQYRKPSFVPPKIAVFIKQQHKEPGEYDIDWDGRDYTKDKRLILAGKYKVKIKSDEDPETNKDETTLQIAKPNSYNYGIHYYKMKKKKKVWHSTKEEIQHALQKQKTLSDGTGFSRISNLVSTADGALVDWQMASVVLWSGHSNPAAIAFHGEEGVRYKKSDRSGLNITTKKTLAPPNASLYLEEKDALADMFLLVLNGCRTGNEVMGIQWMLAQCFPGPLDGIHGPKTTKGLSHFQKINDLPKDGKKNSATLKRLGINTNGKSKKSLTREVQKKLRSYYPGKIDSIFGDKTEKALRNYQQDHPDLETTGKPDEPTLKALKLAERKNISHAANIKGADITIGFIHKIGFAISTDWGIKLWDNLVSGEGVKKAANNAKAHMDQRQRKELEFNIYTQEGVSFQSTLHPSRYGKRT
jgi:peptidoglycan hydrolase-like protein with peptidoglycan-binding domain